jgi:hypothetical protein
MDSIMQLIELSEQEESTETWDEEQHQQQPCTDNTQQSKVKIKHVIKRAQ